MANTVVNPRAMVIQLENTTLHISTIMCSLGLPHLAFFAHNVFDIQTLSNGLLPWFHYTGVSDNTSQVGEQLDYMQAIACNEEVEAIHLEWNTCIRVCF